MRTRHRVLDLTDERGQLAGHILAMVGADVALVEPPGGSDVRSLGPFGGGSSLPFWGWNRGKRSVVIDLACGSGQDELLALAQRSDVVIESGAVPVDLAALRRGQPIARHRLDQRFRNQRTKGSLASNGHHGARGGRSARAHGRLRPSARSNLRPAGIPARRR